VRRLAFVLLTIPVLGTACGSSKHPASPTPPPKTPPSPARVLGAGAKALYVGGSWAVVTRGRTAVAAHLAGGTWHADRSGRVRIAILGPHAAAARKPQVAVELKAPTRFVETGLWVDGSELVEKGGGLHPTDVTIYGAPDQNLARGTHVAVAYGRTQTTGTAVAWVFRVG
jgi:hypothetical protein